MGSRVHLRRDNAALMLLLLIEQISWMLQDLASALTRCTSANSVCDFVLWSGDHLLMRELISLLSFCCDDEFMKGYRLYARAFFFSKHAMILARMLPLSLCAKVDII